MNDYYDEMWGWGMIVFEDEKCYLVRFDSDPWTLKHIPKEEK